MLPFLLAPPCSARCCKRAREREREREREPTYRHPIPTTCWRRCAWSAGGGVCPLLIPRAKQSKERERARERKRDDLSSLFTPRGPIKTIGWAFRPGDADPSLRPRERERERERYIYIYIYRGRLFGCVEEDRHMSIYIYIYTFLFIYLFVYLFIYLYYEAFHL